MASLWKYRNAVRSRSAYRSSASAFAVTASFAVLMGASPAVAQERASGNQGLADIIVTAQKRVENLQDVPVAVTALSQETLENQQVQSFADLGNLAPNLTVLESPTGQSPIFSLRGIVSSNLQTGVDSSVAMYVDGVYLGRTVGAQFDLADIERIEVLAGPQGTLYGKNSTGGAINIITSLPKGEFYARQEVSVGNYGRLRSKTRVDLPAFGDVAVSLSYLHDEKNGWAKNSEAGQVWDFSGSNSKFQGARTSPKRLGDSNTESGRIAVHFEPDGQPITVDYRFDITSSKGTPKAVQVLVDPADVLSGFGIPGLGSQPIVLNPSTKREKTVANGGTTPSKLDVWGHNLTIGLDISDAVKFTSITGYRSSKNLFSVDLAGGSESGFDIFGIPATGTQDYTTLMIALYEKSRTFSQEFQVNYTSDLIDAVGGLYFFDERVTSSSSVYANIFQEIIDLFGTGGANLPIFLPDRSPTDADAFSLTRAQSKNTSFAGYAQGTLHLTDQIDFTAGVRHTKDNRRTISNSVSGGQLVPSFAGDFNHTDWTTNLSYRPSDDVMVYAKVGTGYLSGGVFGNSTFDPEELLQYEIGAKTDLFDRRLRLNFAAFYSDYTDLQTSSIDPATGLNIITNLGKAVIKGGEVTLLAQPFDGFTLAGNYGYTDFQYKGAQAGGSAGAVPKHTLSINGDYRFGELSNGMIPSVNVNASYRSNMRFNNADLGPDANETLRQNAFWKVDARASLEAIPLGNVKGKVSFWVQNLFNEDELVASDNFNFWVNGLFMDPRTYGVDLSVEF